MARPKGGGGDAREKLMAAIGRGFRAGGYGGIGVDGLAREAGLTSGAFYATFSSKAEAFTVAVTQGLVALREAIRQHQEAHGAEWLGPFVDFYLDRRMEVELVEACALPSFSADVARAPAEARHAYTRELTAIAEQIQKGFEGPDAAERGWRLLSILVGAASLARAVDDPALHATIRAAAKGEAKALG